ncbi:hypothetical protein RF11_11766 [Thelohanellus kitauei]|uniref:Uncharacterized protein n=1 Tax=Thelohanellus kitauei TaxID=669202 RepID=A0A0C2N071_THEKT|nr:hypothetical protein RF11_11766 [Thelohanellus kitauei]
MDTNIYNSCCMRYKIFGDDIREAYSSYSLVRVDERKFYSTTEHVEYRMPNVEDLKNKIRIDQVISILKLKNIYYKCRLEEKSKEQNSDVDFIGPIHLNDDCNKYIIIFIEIYYKVVYVESMLDDNVLTPANSLIKLIALTFYVSDNLYSEKRTRLELEMFQNHCQTKN